MQDKSGTTFQKYKDGAQFVLIIFGTMWGIYTFIYKDIIVPAQRPPAVTMTTKLEELDRADGMILVRVHLEVANHGEGKVWIPAIWWNVYGLSFGGKDRTVSEFVKEESPLLERGNREVSRFSDIRLSQIVAAGYVPSHELWYHTKDETVHEQLFLMPEDRFDALQIYAEAYTFKSIDRIAPTRWNISDSGVLIPTLMVKETSGDSITPFSPETNRAHREMTKRESTGHNFTTASLRLKSKELSVKAKP